jgi:hypothetical protein
MKRISLQQVNAAVRTTIVATAVTFAAIPAAFADYSNSGLEKLLAEPTSFVAISDGAPGHVTFASMAGDTLAVQFSIPTHSGEMFGEFVGKVDADGVFVGNGVMIGDNGQGKSSPVSLTFQEDGTIAANVKNKVQGAGFMSADQFYND